MFVDEVLYSVFIRVGNGNATFTVVDAHAIDVVELGHVGDERAMCASELLSGQSFLQSLQVAEGANLSSVG